jgi:hypothetical protein
MNKKLIITILVSLFLAAIVISIVIYFNRKENYVNTYENKELDMNTILYNYMVDNHFMTKDWIRLNPSSEQYDELRLFKKNLENKLLERRESKSKSMKSSATHALTTSTTSLPPRTTNPPSTPPPPTAWENIKSIASSDMTKAIASPGLDFAKKAFGKIFKGETENQWNELGQELGIKVGVALLKVGLAAAGLGFLDSGIDSLFKTPDAPPVPPIDYKKVEKAVTDANFKDVVSRVNAMFKQSNNYLSEDWVLRKNIYNISPDSFNNKNENIKFMTDPLYDQFVIKVAQVSDLEKNKRSKLNSMLMANEFPLRNLLYSEDKQYLVAHLFTHSMDITAEVLPLLINFITMEITYFQELATYDNTLVNNKYVNPWDSMYIGNKDRARQKSKQIAGSLLGKLQKSCQELFDILKTLNRKYYNNLEFSWRCINNCGPGMTKQNKRCDFNDNNNMVEYPPNVRDYNYFGAKGVYIWETDSPHFAPLNWVPFNGNAIGNNAKYKAMETMQEYLCNIYSQIQTFKKIAGVKWLEDEKWYASIDTSDGCPHWYKHAMGIDVPENQKNSTEYTDEGGYPFGLNKSSYLDSDKKGLSYYSPTFSTVKSCDDNKYSNVRISIDATIFNNSEFSQIYSKNMTCPIGSEYVFSCLKPGQTPGDVSGKSGDNGVVFCGRQDDDTHRKNLTKYLKSYGNECYTELIFRFFLKPPILTFLDVFYPDKTVVYSPKGNRIYPRNIKPNVYNITGILDNVISKYECYTKITSIVELDTTNNKFKINGYPDILITSYNYNTETGILKLTCLIKRIDSIPDINSPPYGTYVEMPNDIKNISKGKLWPSGKDICLPFDHVIVSGECTNGNDPGLINYGGIMCKNPKTGGRSDCVQSKMPNKVPTNPDISLNSPPYGIYVEMPNDIKNISKGKLWPSGKDICLPKDYVVVSGKCTNGNDPGLINYGGIMCKSPKTGGRSGCVQSKMPNKVPTNPDISLKPPTDKIIVENQYDIPYYKKVGQWPSGLDICLPNDHVVVSDMCTNGNDPGLINYGGIMCKNPKTGGRSGCVQSKMPYSKLDNPPPGITVKNIPSEKRGGDWPLVEGECGHNDVVEITGDCPYGNNPSLINYGSFRCLNMGLTTSCKQSKGPDYFYNQPPPGITVENIDLIQSEKRKGYWPSGKDICLPFDHVIVSGECTNGNDPSLINYGGIICVDTKNRGLRSGCVQSKGPYT